MFLSLARHGTTWTDQVSEALRGTGIENIFNPSVLRIGDQTWVAFRGLHAQQPKPFRAFVLRLNDTPYQSPIVLDLTQNFATRIGYPVADPKLFEFDGQPWVTFNTGHFEKPNSIYIAPLTPEIGQPLKIEISDRQAIEKNWGFFQFEGRLCALYSLDPLVVLTEHKRSASQLHMQAEQTAFQKPRQSSRPVLTMGTQPVELSPGAGTFALVAHRRFYFRKKRLYAGRPVVVDLPNKRLHIGSSFWFHNLRALRGGQPRHNPNLLSCTYVSGLTRMGFDFVVSYGINDVDFALAQLPEHAWPDPSQPQGE